MKKYLKSLGYIFVLIITLTFLVTILNYIGLFKGTFFTILKFIIPAISMFIGGVIIGKNSEKKGWLNGLKIGVIAILIIVLVSVIAKNTFNIKNIIYYIMLLAICVFGSMIGISKKNN